MFFIECDWCGDAYKGDAEDAAMFAKSHDCKDGF